MWLILICALSLAACGPQTGEELISIEDYPCVTNTGTAYYVDATGGHDTNDGLSPGNAWRTVSKVNGYSFGAGDQILFKAGESWRERIIPQSGTKTGWLYYGSYGTGAKPLFIGSVERNLTGDWSNQGANIWLCAGTTSEDIGNILFNNDGTVGYKQFSQGALSSQGDFYYDPSDGKLYLYSASHPTNSYSDIECALGQHMIYVPHSTYPHIGAVGISNVVIRGLAFTHGGAYGLKFQSVHHIYVLDNDISWMGGAEVDGQPGVRYGNGIEFYDYAYYCKAIGNTIWEMYDSGVSVQGKEGNTAAVGIEFLSNVIWNCGYAGYELWYKWVSGSDGSVLTDVHFNNNICSNAGLGWGSQRPENGGFHVLMDRTIATTSGIQILSNQFTGASSALFVVHRDFNNFSSTRIDYNTWSSSTNTILYYYFHADGGTPVAIQEYMLSESNSYQSFSGKDGNSLFIF